jgi:hypothetical protein
MWCVVCKHAFRDVEALVIHQLEARHWKPILPPATVVDPAQAQRLRQAVESVEARPQQKEVR